MIEHLNVPDDITLVYGPPAAGKTTLCLQFVAACSGKVIFIDTEGTFNVERLQQINPLINLDNVVVIQATRFSEQFAAIKNLALMKNVALVVVDSFTKYYRRKLQEGITIKPVTIRMLKMLRELKIPVLVTSQVYSTMENNNEVKPVGGDLFYRFADYTLYLRKDGDRRSLVVKNTKVEIPFIITNEGLVS